MSTAIALVNRMRAKRREGTSTLLTDANGVPFLDLLNGAITSVLEERTWDFQKRFDGQLVTVPEFTGSASLSATPGSVTLLFSDYSGSNATLYGQFVTRFMATNDPSYGNTAFRIDTASLVTTSVLALLEDAWPGSASATTWKLLTYEYLLPSTVREVLSVKMIENDESLTFSNNPEDFDEAFPRPWADESSRPQVACVGGEVKNTDLLGAVNQDFGLAMRLWPVPDVEYQLDYSYVYRQPRLVNDTDVLNRVPPAVEDLIVDLAVARVITELEKDLQTGLPLEAKILKQRDTLHRNHLPAAGRRPELLAHDKTSTTTNSLMWLSRSVAGLVGS